MALSNVERSAGSQIDWVGSLGNVPLADVFRKIAIEEASGDLQVHMGAAIKTVYFQKGFVVFAASNQKRDRLGESLIEAGRISRHEFALASMLMKSGTSRKKFGEALVQAGVMSEEELGREVAMQVNRIVLSLFKTTEGVYSFDERGTVIPMDLMVSLSIYRILLEGIRFMKDGKLILSGLPPLDTMVRVSNRPPFTVEPRKLNKIEQSTLKSAGKGAPLAALIKGAENRGPALRACYGLYAAGLLEPVAEGQRQPLKVQEETGVFVLSEIQRKFAKIQATNARQEILMEFDRVDRATEQEILKLDHEVSGDAIERAFRSRQAEWEEKRALVGDRKTLVAKIDVIQDHLRRAYEKIKSETTEHERIEAPPEVLEAPTEQTLPPLNEELFDEIGIDFATEGAPPELGTESEPETGFAIADAEPELAEPSDETLPVSSLSPDSPVREDTKPFAEEAAAPEEPKAKKLHGAARVERVRQLMRDVKLHFQVRDWEHAVSLLYELVELDPEDAKHHGMLARAMARHPVMRKDAERHFIEALRLAPQDAELHFSLGLYYKSFGMHSRAQNEFRTTLRINPKHEGAIKHLSSGGRGKDPLRDVFKKIFG